MYVNLVAFIENFCDSKINTMTLSFQGIVSLVTGGASGLGRATVERFVREGARVVICDLPKSHGEKLAQELGSNATFSPTDVSSLSDN